MQCLNLLLISSSYIIVFIIPHCQGKCAEVKDDNLCFDKERYGENRICYFAYMSDINPEVMAMASCAMAEPFVEGVLRDHKNTTAPVFEKDDSVYSFYALLPEDGENVKGMTYLISKEYFISIVVPYQTDNIEEMITQVGKFWITVEIKGEEQNICCNAFVAIPMED